MKFEIKNRWTGEIKLTVEGETLGGALSAAVKVSREEKHERIDLSDADLSDANLSAVKDDLWAVLSAAPKEVEGLKKAIIEGRINGAFYEGECACLVGTIANIRGCKYDRVEGLLPNYNRPIENFFYGIKKGDTPENNQFSKLVLEWIDEWLLNIKNAFSEVKK